MKRRVTSRPCPRIAIIDCGGLVFPVSIPATNSRVTINHAATDNFAFRRQIDTVVYRFDSCQACEGKTLLEAREPRPLADLYFRQGAEP